MITSRHSAPILLAGLAAILATTGVAHAQSLDDLTTRQTYTAHRTSSTDPSGGNLDMRRVDAGKTLTLAELKGPGEITHLWFTLMYPSRSALRKLVLRVWFDDMPEPCVEAPLGDFFGLGHAQVYAYASMPLAVGTHCGLNSYWRMPYAKSARLTLTNDGAQDCPALYYQIDHRTFDRPTQTGLYFHAAYRQAFPPEKGKPYMILQTDGGDGHFVGCNLSVEQQDEGWWGEGDVRVYTDGQDKPIIEGTGSEDDFGGAWCYSREFAYPYFGAPLRARFSKAGILEHCTPDLRGKDMDQWNWPVAWQPGDLWNVYRYHVPDPIPFNKSIQVNIEHGWQGNDQTNWYSSVAYWYQSGSPSSRAALPPATDRMPAYLRPHGDAAGRWEAENLVDVARATAGKIEEAGMEFWGELFSGQYGLQWEATKEGDTLTLPFTVKTPGTYQVVARPCKTEGGGTFTLAIDDQAPAAPVDLYAPPPFPGPFEVKLAETQLKAGQHALKCVCVGADEKAKGKRLLIDWLQTSGNPASQPK